MNFESQQQHFAAEGYAIFPGVLDKPVVTVEAPAGDAMPLLLKREIATVA